MYELKYNDAIYQDGKIVSSRVQIQEDRTIITRVFKSDLSGKTNEELIELTLEQFYQDTYPNRAENERFEQLGDKIKEVDEKLKQIDKVKKELEITQGSVMDLITQLGGLLEKGEHGENKTTENNDKGGDNNDGNVVRN